jgi:hypothetical protein
MSDNEATRLLVDMLKKHATNERLLKVVQAVP